MLGVIPRVQYLTVSRLRFHATRLKSFRSGRCGWNLANLSARKTGHPENDRFGVELFSYDRRSHVPRPDDRPLTIPEVDLTSFDSGVLKSVTVTQLRALWYLAFSLLSFSSRALPAAAAAAAASSPRDINYARR